MAGLPLKVTTAGRAALVNATNTGTLPVTIAQIGITATGFTSSAEAAAAYTALPGELKRLPTFSGAAVADDTLHLTIRDDSADVYSLKGFALYLTDGTLFALYGQVEEIMGKSAQSTLLLSADTVFADIAATSITMGNTDFWNPPATETVQGVVELATPEETATGTDGTRAATPKGVKHTLDQRLGAAAPSTFMKSLLALTTAAALRAALAIKSAALKDEGPGGTLDADLLDGEHGAFYQAWENTTGKPTTISGYGISDAQPLNAALTALSGVTPAAGRLPYFNGATTMTLATLTAAGRALLDDPDAEAQRETLGLGSAALASSDAFAAAGHKHAAGDITSGTFAAARMPAYTGDVTSAAGGTVNTLAASGVIAGSYGASANATIAFGGTIAVPKVTVDGKGRVTGAETYTLTLPAAPTSVPGNAGTATKLATARTLTIGATGKSFDGSANAGWTLEEIGAAAISHLHAAGDITSGTFAAARMPAYTGDVTSAAGGTVNTLAASGVTAGSYGESADATIAFGGSIAVPKVTVDAKGRVVAAATYTLTLPALPTSVPGNAGTATTLATARSINGTSFDGSANITTASWGTARNITIGSTAKSVNGSAAVAWTLAEIGAAGKGANTFTGVQTATGFTVSSSRKLKFDIRALDVQPDIIDLFQPVTFRYKAAPDKEVAGLIREDVAAIFPWAVTEEGIDYGQLVSLLLLILQHERMQGRDMAQRIAALEARGG